ncbi:NAD(P)/FAD-dependent oxidoreductase [Pseudonocardia parietis]|uniref:D-arginine dehydrogenase n=1 Tax=Pseudonocardia parietis TaxID=570936 RepID=A0ABS4VZP6_9PSEU|nr:FAD-binding oxidoreductase [Pseudonocardia parietis]MBP2369379.1 D-arginine dehydrogenase [Pseudonocardia parietis]
MDEHVTDLVVVGGGIAGVSVAYELAAHTGVVLLEAEADMPVHSTARSAATYIPGHGAGPFRALIDASGPRFARLERELGTPPLLSPRPVLHIGVDDEGAAGLAAMLAEQRGEPGAPVALDPAEAQRRAPVLRRTPHAAAWTAGAADVDATALHDGYRRGLRARGGTVLRGARVAELVRDGAGWVVRTAAGHVVRAGAVVDAAGAWADEVAALAGVPGAGLTPYRRTIAACPVPDPSVLTPAGAPLPLIADAAERWYLKPEADTVLVSPADETPQAPGDARPDELDVALALDRVGEATTLGLRSVRTAWAGLRTFAADRAPVLGERAGHPGFHFVAGQGGSGIESAPALAALAASVILGRPAPDDVALAPGVCSATRLD